MVLNDSDPRDEIKLCITLMENVIILLRMSRFTWMIFMARSVLHGGQADLGNQSI